MSAASSPAPTPSRWRFSRTYNAVEDHLFVRCFISYGVEDHRAVQPGWSPVLEAWSCPTRPKSSSGILKPPTPPWLLLSPANPRIFIQPLLPKMSTFCPLLEKVATFMHTTEFSIAAALTDDTYGPHPTSSCLVEGLSEAIYTIPRSPQDLQTWISQVKQYLQTGTVWSQPLATQRAFLNRCINSTLLWDL